MRKVYLDHNATTPLDPEVFEAMLPYLKETFGNPSSTHQFGRKARVALDEAREKVAKFLGARPSEIVFTSGGTEADNLAIRGVISANRDQGQHIITSQIEHHAVLDTCKDLERDGIEVTCLPVDGEGLVSPDQVAESIRPDTVLITIMHANNEVGTIQSIEEISLLAREKGIYMHTDAVQSFGKIPCEVDRLGIDLLSLSAHKIHGPKGIGALYIRNGTQMHALMTGGPHEMKRRGGTENVAAIVGLGKACEIASEMMEREAGQLMVLRDRLHEGLASQLSSVRLNGHPTKRLPTTVNLSFAHIDGESLLINLDLKGIAVSMGSACSSGSLEPSHVLRAMGLTPEWIRGSLRFSVGKENTMDDIDYVFEVLPPIVERLRRTDERRETRDER
ncbi:MAG: cysteine desulfurase NifS [Candidatus Tectomicrobia bacterium]|nr:cysteine desulfurase NifS [Candidatus Tectomicrobia bacterium]